jgi:acetylornithine deacetylase/succinyl-diaminopimelate desuccinylase-like protein
MDARVTDLPEAWLRAQRDRLWAEYLDLVRIPSVSAKPDHAGDVRRAADWVARRCARAGLGNVRILEEGGHPSVYAEWLGAPDMPTILVYAHYDVQPPEPLELWTTPPFEPTLREGRLYARGASDDKATLFISLAAIEAWMATTGRLPCNIKVFYEGEEETGSPTLGAILDRHGALLGADLCLSADGGMMLPDRPDVSVGNRGICKLEFTLRTAAKDMHSGSYGGAILNPLVAIARVIASLHEEDGRVAVPGFYDGVRETTERDRAELAAVPFDEAAWLAGVGASKAWGERDRSVLEKLWLRPTLEINGMWGGYQGEGSKTVLPCEAHAKITCRLVSGQDPKRVQAAVAGHLRAVCPEGATIEIRLGGGGAAAYEIPPDHPALAAIERLLEDVYGKPCFRTRIGGTLPLCALFRDRLGLDTVPMSFSTADEDFHAPNEFFRAESFDRGLTAWVRVFEALASLPRRRA